MNFGIDWEAVGAVAGAAAAVSQVILVTGLAITYNMYKDQQAANKKYEDDRRRSDEDRWDQFYYILDEFYFKILSITIEKPYLLQEMVAGDPDKRQEYDSFAFIVWNFIESIHDYSQKDAKIMETWLPVLIFEARRHGSWFADERNRAGFRVPFCHFVDSHHYAKLN